VKRVRDWDFRLLHFLGGACGSEFFLFPQSAAVSLDVVLIILAEQGRHWLVSSIPQFSGSVLRWFSLAARCLVVDDGSSFGAVLRRIWLRLALLYSGCASHQCLPAVRHLDHNCSQVLLLESVLPVHFPIVGSSNPSCLLRC
jgi:hypothetical protein